jgi:hypothetical protein
MTDINLEQVIVVHTNNGTKLVGSTSLSDAEISDKVENGKPIFLQNVRTLITRMDQSMRLMAAIIPIDLCNTALPSAHVSGSLWYRAGQDKFIQEKFESLFQSAAEVEAEIRANEAGLITRNDGTLVAGGRGVPSRGHQA